MNPVSTVSRVFLIGETLLDIIFENNQPIKAVAGGSMLNSAVSLGRTGIPAKMISEFGNDSVGNLISNFLDSNYVGLEWCYKYEQQKTPLALAFLNAQKNAEYLFYHDGNEVNYKYKIPDFMETDILAFGSFYAIKKDRHQHVAMLTAKAKMAGAFILYDPNIRKNHAAETIQVQDFIFENMSVASMIKGSSEDFTELFGITEPDKVYKKVSEFCSILVITDESKDVHLYTPFFHRTYPVNAIQTVSTIGAGDSFNAGLIYGLTKLNTLSINHLSRDERGWSEIIASGIHFASACCQSLENYVPVGFKVSA
jgi:fructokinase